MPWIIAPPSPYGALEVKYHAIKVNTYLLSYKFRLFPNKEQEEKLANALEINRIIYNYFVLCNFRSRNDMNYALTELKERQPVLYNYHSKMLQGVSVKVAAARKSLAELKRRGHRTGKLLLLKECSSLTYNQSGYKIEGNRLYLSKIGSVKIKLHRHPLNVKQVTIKRKNGRWYAIITCDILRRIYSSLGVSKPVGIDAGITHFAYNSDGNSIENPLFLRKTLAPLKRAHRRMSRKRKGSKNRKKEDFESQDYMRRYRIGAEISCTNVLSATQPSTMSFS